VVGIKDLEDSLIALREILRSEDSAEDRREKIRETFDVYQSVGSDGNGSVLFTGYFESFLKGSLTKTDQYRYPVYGTPGDLICAEGQANGQRKFGRIVDGEFVPYYSRSEIDNQGCLDGRGLELVWVDDPVDLFFMHTQGSGKIELTDGSILEVGFASKNDRPFRSVAPYMIETGKITPRQKSYREIKQYLKDHPDDLPEILGYNQSYVFFRIVEAGPVGAIGEVLTPGRSIATDPDRFSKGALAFMRARKPILDEEGRILSWVPFSRFVVSQDAGGAIKGAGRVDLFCGSGRDAEMLAGSLKEKGELYFLVKKK
jgi:membrane-bound lytic murein transglycosylase A